MSICRFSVFLSLIFKINLGSYNSLSRDNFANLSFNFFINCGHKMFLILSASPVRLVSSSDSTANISSGRLEIFINNTWGTVCGDGFSIDSANLACQELGFDNGNSYISASFIGYDHNLLYMV